jgi:hypothetical protein
MPTRSVPDLSHGCSMMRVVPETPRRRKAAPGFVWK